MAMHFLWPYACSQQNIVTMVPTRDFHILTLTFLCHYCLVRANPVITDTCKPSLCVLTGSVVHSSDLHMDFQWNIRPVSVKINCKFDLVTYHLNELLRIYILINNLPREKSLTWS